MQEKPFHHLFATETEAELEDWVGALKKVIQSNDSTGPQERTKDKGGSMRSLFLLSFICVHLLLHLF